MSPELNRRNFIKAAVAASVGGTIAAGFGPREGAAAGAPAGDAGVPPLPQGRIGGVRISRLILGCNLMTFYIHARDLKFVNNLSRAYNTEEKILETFAVAEAHGINTIMLHDDPYCLSLLRKHRERGGSLQWIVAPKLEPGKLEALRRRVYELASDGAAAMYLHGVQADQYCAEGNLEIMTAALEEIKMAGVPAGVACHDLNVVKFCEEHMIEHDFYVKTLHHHNYPSAPRPDQLKGPHCEIPAYWCKDPTETAALMKEVRKPWIAFKVMAAGAIPPRDAFTYSFSQGADFVLAGMFDFEIKEDAAIASEVLAAVQRERAWLG